MFTHKQNKDTFTNRKRKREISISRKHEIERETTERLSMCDMIDLKIKMVVVIVLKSHSKQKFIKFS